MSAGTRPSLQQRASPQCTGPRALVSGSRRPGQQVSKGFPTCRHLHMSSTLPLKAGLTRKHRSSSSAFRLQTPRRLARGAHTCSPCSASARRSAPPAAAAAERKSDMRGRAPNIVNYRSHSMPMVVAGLKRCRCSDALKRMTAWAVAHSSCPLKGFCSTLHGIGLLQILTHNSGGSPTCQCCC